MSLRSEGREEPDIEWNRCGGRCEWAGVLRKRGLLVFCEIGNCYNTVFRIDVILRPRRYSLIGIVVMILLVLMLGC